MKKHVVRTGRLVDMIGAPVVTNGRPVDCGHDEVPVITTGRLVGLVGPEEFLYKLILLVYHVTMFGQSKLCLTGG